MHYNRVFERSLLISISFHACVGIVFFFITFTHKLPTFKPLEISIVKLPEKEKPEILKPKPEVKKKMIIGAVKRSPKIKAKKSPEDIKKTIVSTPIKSNDVQNVRKIIPPITIPPAPGGLEKDELHGEIPVTKTESNEGISETEKENDSQLNSLPSPTNVEIKDSEEESTGPYVYISGPASKRKALYQPKFNLPYWLEKRGQSVHGKLKIWVLPDGSVDKVEIEESFGYAEIDKLARDAVYKWRFYKLPYDVKRIDWGIVTISIRLE
ncbi:MAG: TonB family protein [bacterium]